MELLTKKLECPGRLLISGAPEGFDALLMAELAQDAAAGLVFVARDDVRLARMAEALAFFAPRTERLEFPAWDCLPYDRVSPNGEIVSRRIDTLTRLLETAPDEAAGRVVLTTVSALLQRVPPRAVFAGATLHATVGRRLDPEALVAFLADSGYVRSGTVMESGEYAVRGGIVDVFPPGRAEPVRLDFFGDDLEGIRVFDPATQRTTGTLQGTALKPVSEMLLDEAAIARFRSGYRVLFGAPARDDPLYEAVSAGRRHMGMEHWLPLFHERLETLLDYVPGWAVILDHQAEAARDARLDLIAEYYAARTTIAGTGLAAAGTLYNPVPPDRLYLDGAAWDTALESRSVGLLSPFGAPEGQAGAVDAGGRPGRPCVGQRSRRHR